MTEGSQPCRASCMSRGNGDGCDPCLKVCTERRALVAGQIVILNEPERVGPIRSRIEVGTAKALADSTGAREWAEHGNCQVYVANSGILDARWTLSEGAPVLIRSTKGGWFMVDLQREGQGWFVVCGSTKVPLTWSDARGSWVSTVEV